MRKLTILLAFFATALSAWSQGWTVADRRMFDDETMVYARLVDQTNGQAVATDEWMVGAFIGGECRGEATHFETGPDGLPYYVLRVFGDHAADAGRTMDFLVCHKSTQATYVCTPSRPVTFTGESEGVPSSPVLLTFNSAVAPVELQGFEVSVDSMVAGEAGQLRLTPVPANATFNPAALHVQLIGISFPAWTDAITCERTSLVPLTYTLCSQVPQTYTLSVGSTPLYRTGSTEPFSTFEVGAPLRLHEGWQWLTNYYGNVAPEQFFSVYGGNALTELRTQHALLYNDPVYGYFGTLCETGLPQNTAYMAFMAADHDSRLWQGTYTDSHTIALQEGWQWMPSPYYWDVPLTQVFDPARLFEGLFIVSKEDGIAEWDGTEWVGTLERLAVGQCYLLYCEKDTVAELSFNSPMGPISHISPIGLTPQPLPVGRGVVTSANEYPNEQTIYSPPYREALGGESFPYSPLIAHRFRENMSVVLRIAELSDAQDYALGAFIGDECRGVGKCIRGRFFITVHCDAGERVSFRLCYLPTGQLAEVSETLHAGGHFLQGSLRYPLLMHSPDAVTGIADNRYGRSASHTYYDLSGRRRVNARAGVVIERRADGTTRLLLK